MIFYILLVCSASMKHVICQPYYDAWFTHVYVIHGNGEIDLIDGGTAKVYRGQEVVTELIYCNYGIEWGWGETGGARLYTKIYRNGELVGTSTMTVDAYLPCNSSRTDRFSSVLWHPSTYSYKVELWWRNWVDFFTEEHLLVDAKEFELKVVELHVSNWNPSSLSVDRGFGTGSLRIDFTNGGNDHMYDVSVSVVDLYHGLTVTPQTQIVGDINEGERKSVTFSVQASVDMTPEDYEITFEVAYNDLRGVTHNETFQADVTVSLNVIWENRIIILLASIIIVFMTVIAFLKLRRTKQTQTKITEFKA